MSAPRSSMKTSCWLGGALASHRGRRVANSGCLIALRDVTGRHVFDDRMLRHENSGRSTRSSAMGDRLGLSMSRFRPAGLTTGGAARMSSFLLYKQ
jgi:hypothetical protein